MRHRRTRRWCGAYLPVVENNPDRIVDPTVQDILAEWLATNECRRLDRGGVFQSMNSPSRLVPRGHGHPIGVVVRSANPQSTRTGRGGGVGATAEPSQPAWMRQPADRTDAGRPGALRVDGCLCAGWMERIDGGVGIGRDGRADGGEGRSGRCVCGHRWMERCSPIAGCDALVAEWLG